ncbi:MAG: thioredoxin fold domain-containing protein [Sphingobacteriaceae bacterium]|nr:thioredoxin fold domain-containing protein [Sphingobacteriaceae bacterium]
MKKILILAFLLVTNLLKAQQPEGIKFEHGNTWAEILEKAKAENKYIFVDAFTTWCGPCKIMTQKIFPLPEVGKFYNERFINVKIQLDVTKTDNEEVKNWYKDAENFKLDYKVNVYPSYLFFNPDGEIIHRAVGSLPEDLFIKLGHEALDSTKQYYTLLKDYTAGNRDPKLLLTLAKVSERIYDKEFAPRILKDYLGQQKDLFTKETIDLFHLTTKKISDPGFAFYRNNSIKIDSMYWKGYTSRMVNNILMRELVAPAVYGFGERKEDVNWKAAEKKLRNDYPDICDEVIAVAKIQNYMLFKNWTKFRDAVSHYIETYDDKVENGIINNYAILILKNCEDEKCIKAALDWSKRSLTGRDEKRSPFMNTYANLLYKSGKKDEAIQTLEEVVKTTKGAGSYASTLEKMKKGEKTW